MTYGDSHQYDEGSQLPDEAKDLIMHAQLNVKDSQMMFSDVFPGTPYVVGTNISVAFVDSDIDFMKAAFEKLKDGGNVELELQETFFSKCYGILTDKFGIRWQFSHQGE